MPLTRKERLVTRSYTCLACGRDNWVQGYIFAHLGDALLHRCECGQVWRVKKRKMEKVTNG